MGGIGSGGWTRLNSKATVDNIKCIDMVTLKKMGTLGRIEQGVFNWTKGKHPLVRLSISQTQVA
jgi:hypothetical protein